jgi:hypothetical protein
VLPSYVDGYSPLVTLADCPAQTTAAGAPLLDAQGRVRAVLLSPASPTSPGTGRRADISLSALHLATNASCLNVPGGANRSLPASCLERSTRSDLQEAIAINLSRLEAGAQTRIEETITEWAVSGPQAQDTRIFRWKSSSFALPPPAPGKPAQPALAPGLAPALEDTGISEAFPATGYLPFPECIEPADEWYSRFRFRISGKKKFSLTIPVWAAFLQLNRDLQHELRFSRVREVKATLEFRPRDAKRQGRSKVSFTLAEPLAGQSHDWTRELPVCKN